MKRMEDFIWEHVSVKVNKDKIENNQVVVDRDKLKRQ